MSIYFTLFCISCVGILTSTANLIQANRRNMQLAEISCLVQNRAIFRIEESGTPIWKISLYLSPNLLLNERLENILNFPINGTIEANMFPSWNIIDTFSNEQSAVEELKNYKSGDIISCYMEKDMKNSNIKVVAKMYPMGQSNLAIFSISVLLMIFSFYCLEKNFILL